MAWIKHLLRPAQDATPGFRSHLKKPLPELPRIAIGGWALSLYLGAGLMTMASDVDAPRDVLSLSLLFWLMTALGLCAMLWLNPWPALGMRTRFDLKSALGDVLGMAYTGLLTLLPLLVMLPGYGDYRGRALIGELIEQTGAQRKDIAEQLLTGRSISLQQQTLPTPTGQAWVGVETDGRMWLYRSDVRVLNWLTPKQTPDGIRWRCHGLGVQTHLNAFCRDKSGEALMR